MLFPWGRVTAGLAGLYLASMFVYRVSHIGGQSVSQACFAAMLIALTAGTLSVCPIAKCWRHHPWRILLGFFLGFLIRLLIISLGVIIIIFFIDINRISFVLFLKLYYFFFLVGDIWLATWMIRHSETSGKKGSLNGNIWDIVEQF
ncbi:MAG TPA: hypothetical protein ENN97_00415 [Phycisphaerales bacterium]|nr:hypothetical protein [Phycisphaerales bacterium]